MKRSVPIALALSLALGLTATTASASDGTIRILGGVDASTCDVTGGPGLTGGTTSNFDVTLPNVSARTLAIANATAGRKPFHITLSGTGCSDNKKVRAYFHPATADVNVARGTLRNQVAGSNVEVELLDGQNGDAHIDLAAYNQTTLAQATIAGNTATLHYAAQYSAPVPATPGAYSSTLVYDIDYE